MIHLKAQQLFEPNYMAEASESFMSKSVKQCIIVYSKKLDMTGR